MNFINYHTYMQHTIEKQKKRNEQTNGKKERACANKDLEYKLKTSFQSMLAKK